MVLGNIDNTDSNSCLIIYISHIIIEYDSIFLVDIKKFRRASDLKVIQPIYPHLINYKKLGFLNEGSDIGSIELNLHIDTATKYFGRFLNFF